MILPEREAQLPRLSLITAALWDAGRAAYQDAAVSVSLIYNITGDAGKLPMTTCSIAVRL